MKDALKIACVGEAMVEIVATTLPGPAQLNVAGDTLNTAIYLRRAIAVQHEVYYVSALGTDPLSDQMLVFMRAEGVKTQRIKRDPELLPGLYSITNDERGERTFNYWRESSAAKRMFHESKSGLSFSALNGFDLVYASAISLAILPDEVRAAFLDWIADFRKKGGLFAFDSNFRPRLWESKESARECVERAWSLCDLALPSVDDEMALFEEKDEHAVLARFKTYSHCTGVLKRGELGPCAINADIDKDLSFALAQRVVDTTAAGDSFSGAFLGSYLADQSLEKAMIRGHENAVRVIGHQGAIMPRDGQ